MWFEVVDILIAAAGLGLAALPLFKKSCELKFFEFRGMFSGETT